MEREGFGALLGANANYLSLRTHTKRPLGSYKEGKKNRLKKIPLEGNYGVIPQKRLVVLDVDVHRNASLQDQVELFEELLGVNLRNTLSVRTASGGWHFYLFLPRKVDLSKLPKASLRVYQDEISDLLGRTVTVDADFRSGAVLGYVVGPGSTLGESGNYVLNGDSILSLSNESVEKLYALVDLRQKKQAVKRRYERRAQADKPVIALPTVEEMPEDKTIQELRLMLHKRRFETYHQQRALIKRVLGCCFTDQAIAETCIRLHLDQDSYTGTLSYAQVFMDVARFNPLVTTHGVFCGKGGNYENKSVKKTATSPAATPLADQDARALKINDLREKAAQAVEARSLGQHLKSINPRVLDFVRISDALLQLNKQNRLTAQYRNAMAIMEFIVHPLCNVGALRMLLNREFLMKELDLSSSAVTQAMRLLRQAEVLQIVNKQSQGLTTTYTVPEVFTSRRLTVYLRRTWWLTVIQNQAGEECRPNLFLDHRSGAFREAIGGKPVYTTTLLDKQLQAARDRLLAANPTVLAFHGKLDSYLREESQWRRRGGLIKTISLKDRPLAAA